MSQAVIKVENLTRRFGDFVAVDHVNFEVQAGEVVG
jgi:ABC-2 type transport system ATP-binding protein